MAIIYSHFFIDKILYSSPDFPSGKDIIHPKRPPIQEATTGQKRYRYAVLPKMFAKIRLIIGFCVLSGFGMTIKNSLIQRIKRAFVIEDVRSGKRSSRTTPDLS